MVNDTVDILDAVIVNIQVNFVVVIELNRNPNEVLNSCLQSLKEKYSSKFNIGEPFYVSDIYKTLNNVDGVIDTSTVTIERKHRK